MTISKPFKDPAEKILWEQVSNMFGHEMKRLGPASSRLFFDNPRELSNILSRYKFVAQIASKNRNVLELGCGEGLGAPILSHVAKHYTGIDENAPSIQAAKKLHKNRNCSFLHGTFLDGQFGHYDLILCLNMANCLENIPLNRFINTLQSNLNEQGVCLLGLRKEDAPLDAITKEMEDLFHNVFLFSMNDEIVHTGDISLSQYIILLGCFRKK